MSAHWAAGFVVYFSDGTDDEIVIHIGEKQQCEEALRLCPGVAYSGDRPVDRAEAVLVECRP